MIKSLKSLLISVLVFAHATAFADDPVNLIEEVVVIGSKDEIRTVSYTHLTLPTILLV